jgi:hypothetical protein
MGASLIQFVGTDGGLSAFASAGTLTTSANITVQPGDAIFVSQSYAPSTFDVIGVSSITGGAGAWTTFNGIATTFGQAASRGFAKIATASETFKVAITLAANASNRAISVSVYRATEGAMTLIAGSGFAAVVSGTGQATVSQALTTSSAYEVVAGIAAVRAGYDTNAGWVAPAAPYARVLAPADQDVANWAQIPTSGTNTTISQTYTNGERVFIVGCRFGAPAPTTPKVKVGAGVANAWQSGNFQALLNSMSDSTLTQTAITGGTYVLGSVSIANYTNISTQYGWFAISNPVGAPQNGISFFNEGVDGDGFQVIDPTLWNGAGSSGASSATTDPSVSAVTVVDSSSSTWRLYRSNNLADGYTTSWAYIIPAPSAPLAPTNIAFSSVDADSITATVTPAPTGDAATSYKLFTRVNPSPTWLLVATQASPIFDVQGLTGGTAYEWSAIATNAVNDSPRSATFSQATPAAALDLFLTFSPALGTPPTIDNDVQYTVTVLNASNAPVSGVSVTASSTITSIANTDANGVTTIPPFASGDVSGVVLSFAKAGYTTATRTVAINDAEITVTGGGTVGQSGPPAPVPTVTGVTISPTTASIPLGAMQPFTASVQGTNNPSQAISWSAPDGGAANSSGVYTALSTPGAEGTYRMRATSAFNANFFVEATITVTNNSVPVDPPVVPPVTVTVSIKMKKGPRRRALNYRYRR